MTKKEQKKKAEKKNTPGKEKKAKKKGKKQTRGVNMADDGLVIIDEQIEEDKEAELEARKAYLEEARSQEVED